MESPFVLSEQQRQTLRALADVIVQPLSEADEKQLAAAHPEVDRAVLHAFARTSGTSLGLPEEVEATVAKHLPPDKQSKFGLLLSVLNSRLGMLVLCGSIKPFAALPPRDQERALVGLRMSAIPQKRQIFMTLKNIIALKAFGRNTAATNPANHGKENCSVWEAVGYDGPATPSEVEAVTRAAGREEPIFETLNARLFGSSETPKSLELSVEVIIVGSGCGGSVVAAHLAQAGHQVLVLEKGPAVRRGEVSGEENAGLDRLYESGGLLASEDSNVTVLAGSTLGGGTAVNWACSLRTMEHVKQEWATDHGLTMCTDGSFDQALDAVCARLSVKGEGVAHNPANALVMEACEKLNYPIKTAPQAMADVGPDAPGAGFIGHGDRFGIKQSMLETYLRDAASASTPAQFLDRCHVERVLHEGGKAVGVKALVTGAGGKTKHALTVRAPVVVVSGGAINSPALLLRSGLPNKNGQIGKNLRLHPVAGGAAIMPKDVKVRQWRGAPMTTVSDVVAAGPTGDNYGPKLEVPHMHPGFAALTMQWSSGLQFKSDMMDADRLLPMIALGRDKTSGEVKLDSGGRPCIYYPYSDHTQKALMEGVDKVIRILAATGAEKISTGHTDSFWSLPPPSAPEARAAEVERRVQEARRVGLPIHKVGRFSAHQMGTCKMGANPKQSVVNPRCEVWECSGLFVVDSSTFPTSSGTNPMITTLAIAHLAAEGLKKSLLKPQGGKSGGMPAVAPPRSRL